MKQNPGNVAAKPAQRTERPPAAPPRFMELIPPNLGIDFVRLAPMMIGLSAIVILAGLASVWWKGVNYGIDFAGGTVIQVRFQKPTPIADVRAALERQDFQAVVVQDVGGSETEFQIRVLGNGDNATATTSDAARTGLREKFGEGTYDVLRVESVGPKVGKELWRQALLAVLVSTLMMGIYIAFRFDLRFGVGAAAALVHDVVVAIGALSIANMEFDLTTVAALLTIVGFSVNDTVIISDRIRENMRKMRKEPLAKIINVSINETLSRTVITSGTAIIVITALFFLGGSVIHSFAFTLLVGFIVGTYSSIFIASPIVLYLQRWRHRPA